MLFVQQGCSRLSDCEQKNGLQRFSVMSQVVKVCFGDLVNEKTTCDCSLIVI